MSSWRKGVSHLLRHPNFYGRTAPEAAAASVVSFILPTSSDALPASGIRYAETLRARGTSWTWSPSRMRSERRHETRPVFYQLATH